MYFTISPYSFFMVDYEFGPISCILLDSQDIPGNILRSPSRSHIRLGQGGPPD